MPHFIIECSENVLQLKSPQEIIKTVYNRAEASGLFAKNDIKVRLSAYAYYQLGEGKEHFLHVFGHIMEGRTAEQKATLSRGITKGLNELLPTLSILSINVSDFDAATYCNKALINSANTSNDRHFGGQ